MKKLNRSGTSSRIIHYSMPKYDQRFNYQDQRLLQNYNPNIELKGNLKPNKSTCNITNDKEVDPFRKVCLKNLPDSKRTINPEFDSEYKPAYQRSKSSLGLRTLNNNNNNNNIISNNSNNTGVWNNMIDKTESETRVSSKCRRNNYVPIKSNVINYDDSNSNKVPFTKPIIKFNEYSKYNKTTQITNLPGGAKREQAEINDDKKSMSHQIQRNIYKSTQKKIDVDYKSNISCLPSKQVSIYITIVSIYHK